MTVVVSKKMDVPVPDAHRAVLKDCIERTDRHAATKGMSSLMYWKNLDLQARNAVRGLRARGLIESDHGYNDPIMPSAAGRLELARS